MVTQVFDFANYTLSTYAIPTFVTAVFIFLLGSLVCLREQGSQVSVLFFWLTLTISMWLFAFSWMYCATDERVALWWAKAGTLAVAFIPSAIVSSQLAELTQMTGVCGKRFLISLSTSSPSDQVS